MGAYGSPNLSNKNSSIFVKCPHCGQETAKNYAMCPNCGKKMSKPFYKKWWVWLVIIIIVYNVYLLGSISPEEFEIMINGSSSRTYEIIQESPEEKEIRENKEKSEFIMTCKSYTYEELARNPDTLAGNSIKFTGKVVQVIEEEGHMGFRVDMTKNKFGYEDTVYCIYQYSKGESRILEGDEVEIYGICNGETSYISVAKTKITLPCVQIKYYDLKITD